VPRLCLVCSHPEREEIDRCLVEGVSFRIVSKRFTVSVASIQRHNKDHIPAHIAKAQEAAQVANADDLLQQLKALRNKAIGILQKAETAGDYRTALMGIREARGCIEVLMEVEGELDRRGVVNITVSADWVEIRSAILVALHPYPDAAQAVAAALLEAEGVNSHAAD